MIFFHSLMRVLTPLFRYPKAKISKESHLNEIRKNQMDQKELDGVTRVCLDCSIV